MTTELTLTIEDKVIESARLYAQTKGESLSHLVESYLKSISIAARQNEEETFSPEILKLRGVITLPDGFDYKKELGTTLQNRYAK